MENIPIWNLKENLKKILNELEKEICADVLHQLVQSTYNEDKIKRIYVSGDGAEWIKFGVKYLPNAVYVLDLFHLQNT